MHSPEITIERTPALAPGRGPAAGLLDWERNAVALPSPRKPRAQRSEIDSVPPPLTELPSAPSAGGERSRTIRNAITVRNRDVGRAGCARFDDAVRLPALCNVKARRRVMLLDRQMRIKLELSRSIRAATHPPIPCRPDHKSLQAEATTCKTPAAWTARGFFLWRSRGRGIFSGHVAFRSQPLD
jgi:hypothetical protein